MEGVPSEGWIILFLLHFFGLELLVPGAHIARGILVLGAGLGAFDDDGFSWHDLGKTKKI